MTSLNPVFTVGYQLVEPIRAHMRLSKAAARARAAELLALVGIPDARRRLDDYPHQFSGGMRQRVMIAMALSCDPKLLIADEPTTALDVTIQAQILEIVRELRQRLGMGIIWITHDLGLVAGIADRVMVMYAGLRGRARAGGRDLRRPAASLHPGAAAARCRASPAGAPGGCGPSRASRRCMTGRAAACPFAPRCRARLQPLPGREPAAAAGRAGARRRLLVGRRGPGSRAMSPEPARAAPAVPWSPG